MQLINKFQSDKFKTVAKQTKHAVNLEGLNAATANGQRNLHTQMSALNTVRSTASKA